MSGYNKNQQTNSSSKGHMNKSGRNNDKTKVVEHEYIGDMAVYNSVDSNSSSTNKMNSSSNMNSSNR